MVTADQSQPACRLGAGCHQISQLPFALAPGGETARNGLETYICNSGCVRQGQETVGSSLVPPRLCLPLWKKVRDGKVLDTSALSLSSNWSENR